MTDSDIELYDKRRTGIIRHIDQVCQYCVKLGERLIEKGEFELGHNLIANGYCHDQSKFRGAEWLFLNDETKESNPVIFAAALKQHISTNKHHPEAWIGGVHDMDRLHLAEMVCDWAARSSEFGTDVRTFFKDKASRKYDMCAQSKPYREIKGLLDILLDGAFK